MSYVKVTMSLNPQDLADFDEWCAAAKLPRGAGVGALLRLVRSLSRTPTVTGLRGMPRDVTDAQTGQPLTLLDSETVGPRRVVEPVGVWEP